MRWILCLSALGGRDALPAAAATPRNPPTPARVTGRSAMLPRSYLGKPMEQVRVFVDGQLTADPRSPTCSRRTSAARCAMADVRESIGHLYSLGRFQDVRVDAAADSGRRGQRALRPRAAPQRRERWSSPARSVCDRGLLRRTIADRYGARPPLSRARPTPRGRSKRSIATTAISPRPCASLPEQRRDPVRTILTFEIDAGRAGEDRRRSPSTARSADDARDVRAAAAGERGAAVRGAGAATPAGRLHAEAAQARLSTKRAPTARARSRRTAPRST